MAASLAFLMVLVTMRWCLAQFPVTLLGIILLLSVKKFHIAELFIGNAQDPHMSQRGQFELYPF